MSKKPRPSILEGLDLQPEGQATKTAEVVPIAPPAPPKSNTVKSSVYLPPKVHQKLREIAFTRNCKIHDLIMEGLDHVLTQYGHPNVSSLKNK